MSASSSARRWTTCRRAGATRCSTSAGASSRGDTPFNDQHELRAAGSLLWPIVAYEHPPDALYCTASRGTVTGGYVYRGQQIPALRGRYVFGDWCSGEIWTLRVRDGRASDVRKEAATVPSLVSFGEDGDGELYAISLIEGTLYRLVP